MTCNKKEEPLNNGTGYTRELLEANYQGVKRLFVLAYDHTDVNSKS